MQYARSDVANKASAIRPVAATGEVLIKAPVAIEVQALRQAVSGYGRLRVALEAPPLAEWLARVIKQIGDDVVVIDARSVERAWRR